MKPYFSDLKISTTGDGFYQGYSLPIALISKMAISILVVWALIWPANASSQLGSFNLLLLDVFNEFYILTVGGFVAFLFVIALLPATGKRLLGRAGEKPEFSNFSWFSMMFGAGLGVGLMVYATAEPVSLWGSNPAIVAGEVEAKTAEALTPAFRYAFAHFGFHIWAIYVVTGLALAYYAYTRDMPMTIRTALCSGVVVN